MEAQQHYGAEVTFVGVPGLAEPDEMQDFIDETGVGDFTHIPDAAGEIWERFGVTAQRTYVFIDDSGEWRRSGYGSLLDDVEDLLER